MRKGERTMGKQRAFAVLVAIGLVAALLAGCGDTSAVEEPASTPAGPGAPVTVTDLAGRPVEVPESVDSVIALGPGTLRLLCYVGAVDRVIGIEEIEARPPIQRPYLLAYPELLELPIIGPGGPDSTPDAERILAAGPDVIFIAQIVDKDAADKLQAATGIPVFVVTYGDLGSFDEELFDSVELVGEVLGVQPRAADVVSFVRDAIGDLGARGADVPEAERPSAYAGALGFKGLQGIESTQGRYPPFAGIGANSVTASLGQQGSVMIDKEQLLEWDPDYLFIDRSGLSLVLEDVSANRGLYEALGAVREGRVHTQIPFNNYWTNVETALANSYYAGTVLFPDEFADVDAAAKHDEISEYLLGMPLHDQLVEVYGGGFGTVDLLADGE
jgi:iron complex transport system substrate-binding protein